MLCREYFPYTGLTMSSSLKNALTHYYDFMTAYENLLRDGGSLNVTSAWVPRDDTGNVAFNAWTPRLGKVTAFARVWDNRTVVHLLNFRQADSLSWRDMDGTMPAPELLQNIPLHFNNVKKTVTRVCVATPDAAGGAMQELAFTQEGGILSFTLPSLLYWSMLVITTQD